MSFDSQQLFVARVDSVELLRGQNLVLREVDLAATLGRSVDQAIDSFSAGNFLPSLWVKFKIKAVAVFGKRQQTVVPFVRAKKCGN